MDAAPAPAGLLLVLLTAGVVLLLCSVVAPLSATMMGILIISIGVSSVMSC